MTKVKRTQEELLDVICTRIFETHRAIFDGEGDPEAEGYDLDQSEANGMQMAQAIVEKAFQETTVVT